MGAAVDVDTVGVPKIFVIVEAGAVEPKPVNDGVLVAAPNTGPALLVDAPKMFVVD